MISKNKNRSWIVDLLLKFYFFNFLFVLSFILYRFFQEGFSKEYFLSKIVLSLIILFFIGIIIFGIYQKRKSETLLLLISVTIVFFSLEFFLSLQQYEETSKLNSHVKTKKQVYDELKKKEKVVPSFSLKDFFNNKLTIDGEKKILLSFPSHTRVISCLRNKKWKFYKTDRYGFNNIDKKWDSNNKIFMVGDSFGVGECVNQQDTLEGQISNLLKEYSLINLSQTGNGPLLEIASFIEYAEKFKPKILIWFYFEGNDLFELRDEKKQKLLMNYINEKDFNQNLNLYQSNIDNHIISTIETFSSTYQSQENLSKKVYKFFTLSLLRSRVNLIKSNYNARTLDNVDDLFFEIINKANMIMKNNNGKIYFVYMPSSEKISKPHIISRKKIINYLTDKKITLIDMQEVFNVLKLEVNDQINGHYIPEAYKLISEQVVKSINLKN